MKEEHIPLVAEEGDLAAIRERMNEKLSEIYNEFTEAPVNFPYRNAIKELISAATHLNSEVGTTRTNSQIAQAKIAAVAAELQGNLEGN